MSKKIAVTVLCGGASTEHEISVQSATNVIKALDHEKYIISVIYITQEGKWFYSEKMNACLDRGIINSWQENKMLPITVLLGAKRATFKVLNQGKTFQADCVFPMLHGTRGEDGCIQGLLELIDVPYVGDDVLSSSMCMDKDITKQLLRANGIATVPWVSFNRIHACDITYQNLTHTLGDVLFIKPNSLGSSVGVSRVTSQKEFNKALQEGFQYDERLIVEPCIVGREIECAVLGNQDPVAALPAEIVSRYEFYTYHAKYIDPQGATTMVPAKLSSELVENIQQMSIDAFKVLRCSGMLRVDFFLVDDKTAMINEVNTIPGFTNISMYPQMWQVSGISYSELLDELINLALNRHHMCLQFQRVYSHQEKNEIKHVGEGRLS